ncbi:hypothetical protein RFI_40038 [Reticulomyxa filosa]|uniref:Uncharacterized protein n=1 Tax=Reticulomyxa filosa TaxID=46433 RepID=X6L8S4_RETFI|nr:hypothetical protein RFI_40038 [Reticulomyxa filosa]|eukprot:ETN97491.1 hypothetical protein RFI_40038 [Reticulomyxa filosa]
MLILEKICITTMFNGIADRIQKEIKVLYRLHRKYRYNMMALSISIVSSSLLYIRFPILSSVHSILHTIVGLMLSDSGEAKTKQLQNVLSVYFPNKNVTLEYKLKMSNDRDAAALHFIVAFDHLKDTRLFVHHSHILSINSNIFSIFGIANKEEKKKNKKKKANKLKFKVRWASDLPVLLDMHSNCGRYDIYSMFAATEEKYKEKHDIDDSSNLQHTA